MTHAYRPASNQHDALAIRADLRPHRLTRLPVIVNGPPHSGPVLRYTPVNGFVSEGALGPARITGCPNSHVTAPFAVAGPPHGRRLRLRPSARKGARRGPRGSPARRRARPRSRSR